MRRAPEREGEVFQAVSVAVVSVAMTAWLGLIAVPPADAQTRVTSLDALRRELAAGDFITVVPSAGAPIAGRLIRLGTAALDVRLVERTPTGRVAQDVTVALDAIHSLERPRDPVRNGALLGAGIGAGLGGALFLQALAVDRNEIDEWAPFYAGATAACTGIGALIGWAVDAARSKPHIRFEAPSKERATLRVQPLYSQARGIGLAVSFTR